MPSTASPNGAEPISADDVAVARELGGATARGVVHPIL